MVEDKLTRAEELLRQVYALLADIRAERAAEREHLENLAVLAAKPLPGQVVPVLTPLITAIPPPPAEDE